MQAGLVPLIEPEVVADGNHSIKTAQRVYQEVLSHVFKALQDHHIFLEGLLLEVNFVRAGQTHCHQSSIEENAIATLEVLQRTVPPAVPGECTFNEAKPYSLPTSRISHINSRKPLVQQEKYNHPQFRRKNSVVNEQTPRC